MAMKTTFKIIMIIGNDFDYFNDDGNDSNKYDNSNENKKDTGSYIDDHDNDNGPNDKGTISSDNNDNGNDNNKNNDDNNDNKVVRSNTQGSAHVKYYFVK